MYPLLIDVSYYQGKMDWDKALSAGAKGAIIRAGGAYIDTGINFTDTQYANNLAAFHRMPCSAYWFFMPNFDPAKQAEYFAELVKGQPFVRLFVDVEKNGGLDKEKVADALSTFILRLRQLSPVKAGIYTRASFWNTYVAWRPLFAECELWCARYNSVIIGPWSDSDTYRPKEWTAWRLWQYSADGNGRGAEFGAESISMDLNYYNGSLEEYYAWAGVVVPDYSERLSALEAGHNELLAAADQLRGVIGLLQDNAAKQADTLATRGEQIQALQEADNAFMVALSETNRVIGNHEQRITTLERGNAWTKRDDPGLKPLPLEPGPGLPKPKPVAE